MSRSSSGREVFSGESQIEGGGEKSAICRSNNEPEGGVGGGGGGLPTLEILGFGGDSTLSVDDTGAFSSLAKSSLGL